MIDLKSVFNVVAILVLLLGGFMFTALPFSFYHGSHDAGAISAAAFCTLLFGGLLWWITKDSNKKIGKREGYLVVAIGWTAISLVSTLPYFFSGTFHHITDAIFESVSGLTTTGATVINDIEKLPAGILYWRSLTQWLGGMGIIVLTIAIFPLLGIGGVELFVAEAPGPKSDKIHPRIKETAKRIWLLYLGLTILLISILYFAGLSFFDAVNHGLTTLSTGGFSTKNASIAHFGSPAIEYIITFFMFLGGVNFTVTYFGITGNFKKVWKSDEFKTYVILLFTLILFVSFFVFHITDHTLERSFREAAFQIISIVTTTGYVSADYTSWSPALTLLFFSLLFIGGCAGSTAGGIKIIRHLVFFKNSILEFKRLLHPNAVIRMKIDQDLVAPRILTHILVFLLIYLILFVFSSVVMAFIVSEMETPILTSIGAVATCLGNVGPAIGDIGPMDNFANIPPAGKWLCVFLMLLGRLELFTILILFTPYFWRMN